MIRVIATFPIEPTPHERKLVDESADWPIRLTFGSVEDVQEYMRVSARLDHAEKIAEHVVERLRADGNSKPSNARRDRNLVTVPEFAAALDVAESTVFEWIKLGLPSVKATGLGRRIRRREAEAFIDNGGLSRSRVARKRTAKRRAAGTVTNPRTPNVV